MDTTIRDQKEGKLLPTLGALLGESVLVGCHHYGTLALPISASALHMYYRSAGVLVRSQSRFVGGRKRSKNRSSYSLKTSRRSNSRFNSYAFERSCLAWSNNWSMCCLSAEFSSSSSLGSVANSSSGSRCCSICDSTWARARPVSLQHPLLAPRVQQSRR